MPTGHSIPDALERVKIPGASFGAFDQTVHNPPTCHPSHHHRAGACLQAIRTTRRWPNATIACQQAPAFRPLSRSKLRGIGPIANEKQAHSLTAWFAARFGCRRHRDARSAFGAQSRFKHLPIQLSHVAPPARASRQRHHGHNTSGRRPDVALHLEGLGFV